VAEQAARRRPGRRVCDQRFLAAWRGGAAQRARDDVTDGFFDTLGLAPLRGATRDIAGTNTSVALSARLVDEIGRDGPWRERGITLGTNDVRVGAVMPPSFTFPSDRTDLWVPADAVPIVTFFTSRDQRRFNLIGRITGGATLQQAQDDVRRVAREVDAERAPGQQRDATIRFLDETLREGARRSPGGERAGAAGRRRRRTRQRSTA
jgi:hypothetical protein